MLQPLPPLDARVFGARTASTCDVGVCVERRQTVCTEPFRLGNAARRRGALRVRNAAFLIANFGTANERGAVMLKSTSAVMAAALFAGVLTLLWATNTWIDARARDAAPQSTPVIQTAPAPAAVAISPELVRLEVARDHGTA